jgi:hypothetical protein
MKIQEAREIGNSIAGLVTTRQYNIGTRVLSPILAEKTPFRLLDVIGAQIGNASFREVNPFLDRIAGESTMGGWIVIASALRQELSVDLPVVFNLCCQYVESADVWYATDSFGERVPGPALVTYFDQAITQISPWRDNPNRWIRRMVGVAVHYWAKQAHGDRIYLEKVNSLLDLLEPMFTERNQDAIKGVGWGLKTLGKFYPDIMADWLTRQIDRPHRTLMLRKAGKYLPPELILKITEKSE